MKRSLYALLKSESGQRIQYPQHVEVRDTLEDRTVVQVAIEDGKVMVRVAPGCQIEVRETT